MTLRATAGPRDMTWHHLLQLCHVIWHGLTSYIWGVMWCDIKCARCATQRDVTSRTTSVVGDLTWPDALQLWRITCRDITCYTVHSWARPRDVTSRVTAVGRSVTPPQVLHVWRTIWWDITSRHMVNMFSTWHHETDRVTYIAESQKLHSCGTRGRVTHPKWRYRSRPIKGGVLTCDVTSDGTQDSSINTYYVLVVAPALQLWCDFTSQLSMQG